MLHPPLPVGTTPRGAPNPRAMAESSLGQSGGSGRECSIRSIPWARSPVVHPVAGTKGLGVPWGASFANIARLQQRGMMVTGTASKQTRRRHFKQLPTHLPEIKLPALLTHNASLAIHQQLIHLLMMFGHFYTWRT